MTPDRRPPHDTLDDNLGKLLSRIEPEMTLPPEDKRRILEAIGQESREAGGRGRPGAGTGRRRPRGRLVEWLAAAAAVLAVVTIVLWPGGLDGGLAWADVVRHLEEVTSFTGWARIDEVAPDGRRTTTHARLFQKDPSLSRTEFLDERTPFPPTGGTTDLDQIRAIRITAASTDRATILRAEPDQMIVHRTTLTFGGKAARSRVSIPRDLISLMWERLRAVTSDQTRVVDRKTIEGTEVVGFEVELAGLVGDDPAAPDDGTVLVWADADTGVPLEIELKFTGRLGHASHTTYGGLEWNVPLPDELFEIDETEGWTFVDDGLHRIEFFGARLKEGITLTIGPVGGPPALTETDIEAITSGTSTLGPGEARREVTVNVVLSPAGQEKIRAYTSEHHGERLVIDFNGEMSLELTIGGTIGREFRLDISRMGITLEQFADRFLTE